MKEAVEKRIDYYILDDTQYKKIKPIKNGAYGSIYLVEELGTKKQYAAKQMLSFNSYDNFKYFVREIDIFMRINNYCVIGFKGFSFRFGDLNFPTIFLEYAENGSIQNKLNEARKCNLDPNWTPTKRMIALVGISYGMMKLHENNLIHRDLKPDNILLDSNYHPKITDFGLSKFENKNLEQSIDCCGTPLYMAPEISSDPTFTNSIDVYSYAIMAYEIITLKPPYNLKGTENNYYVLSKVVEGMRPEIKEGDMPKTLQNMLEKCWSPNPSERLTFRDITKLLFKEEYSMPDIDEEEYLEYINNIGQDYESSNTTNEASLQIDEANNGNLEQIKAVADNFFEGKEGFPHDDSKALHYYRLYSIMADKQNRDKETANEPPISGRFSDKKISSRKLKAQTVVLAKPDLKFNEKIDFLPLTQRALQLKITNYSIMIYGNKGVRSTIIDALSYNQMVSQGEITPNFLAHRIYSCGISLVEAKNIGLIGEDDFLSFVKEKASKAPKEERLKHCFYCLTGDEDSIFTDNDERIIKYLSKYLIVTIFILQCSNNRFRDHVLKHTSGSYFLEDAMSNPNNAKKGPCIVGISPKDEVRISQKIQNYINFLPSILV